MGGHRRDQSDSRMPLRQSEVQASFDAQELTQVRVESPPRTAAAYLMNGTLNQSCTQFSEPSEQPARAQRVRNRKMAIST